MDTQDKSLKVFLRRYLNEAPPVGVDKTTRYTDVSVDLRDDGEQEILVYVQGRDWCGSGGCITLILIPKEASYRVVMRATITRPPIRILASKTDGWHDIGVLVAGGGINPGYEARLQFNGKKYPNNPSIPPAKRIVGEVAGKIVIPSDADGTPLYP